jgi:ATP-dependent RNA helicase RhlE
VEVPESDQEQALVRELLSGEAAYTLIFVATPEAADALDFYLYSAKLPITSAHQNRDQDELDDAITAFKKGVTPILILTHAVCPQLDLFPVYHIMNVGVPSVEEYYERINMQGVEQATGIITVTTICSTGESGEYHSDMVKTLAGYSTAMPNYVMSTMRKGRISYQAVTIQ